MAKNKVPAEIHLSKKVVMASDLTMHNDIDKWTEFVKKSGCKNGYRIDGIKLRR